MKALLVIDAQNEFSAEGQRPVPNFLDALARIQHWVREARRQRQPIAWVQHHNKPSESKAFVPGSWGAAFAPGLGPQAGHGPEPLFVKDVFGPFSGTGIGDWLREQGVTQLLVVGFYAHMCVSTTVREALTRGFDVQVDPDATGSRDLEHPVLGRFTADEIRRSALLQLVNMGAEPVSSTPALAREGAGAGARVRSPA